MQRGMDVLVIHLQQAEGSSHEFPAIAAGVTGFSSHITDWGVVEGTTTFDQNGRATEFYSVRLNKDSL